MNRGGDDVAAAAEQSRQHRAQQSAMAAASRAAGMERERADAQWARPPAVETPAEAALRIQQQSTEYQRHAEVLDKLLDLGDRLDGLYGLVVAVANRFGVVVPGEDAP